MKWNGIVSWPGSANIRAVLAAAKMTQPGKSQRLAGDKAVSDIAHRFNRPPFQLRAQPADTYIHDVAAWIEGVAPHICEQFVASADLTRVPHEMPHQDELSMGQRDLPVVEAE